MGGSLKGPEAQEGFWSYCSHTGGENDQRLTEKYAQNNQKQTLLLKSTPFDQKQPRLGGFLSPGPNFDNFLCLKIFKVLTFP